MTTVAWDGKTLAADTCMSDDYAMYFDKTCVLEDGRLFAAAGNVEDILLAIQWLNDGGDKPAIESMKSIVVNLDGKAVFLDEKLIEIKMYEQYGATGSGSQFAISALSLGSTAEEAVAIAARYDINTRLPITSVSLKKRKRNSVA